MKPVICDEKTVALTRCCAVQLELQHLLNWCFLHYVGPFTAEHISIWGAPCYAQRAGIERDGSRKVASPARIVCIWNIPGLCKDPI